MNELTETDVILANHSFIAAVAQRYGKGLEYDDRMTIATFGFLIAVRSFRKSLVTFRAYAEATMAYFLRQEHLKQNQYCKVESRMSLDQPVEPDGAGIGEIFLSNGEDMTDSLVICDFLEQLNSDLRMVAVLFIDGFSEQEITARLKIPEVRLRGMTDRLRSEWVIYNQACG